MTDRPVSMSAYMRRGRSIDLQHALTTAATLARVEDKITDTKPTVLALCTHNGGRSQMALGYFNHLAGDHGVAWSGGSEPGDDINPAAVAAMAEVGIDITREFPSRGPTRSSRLPTSSSPWDAATHARSS